MSVIHESPKRSYINVMELLVSEEVDRQLRGLSPRVARYVKRIEVETYALNRLPPLYASSEKGWQHQYEKAKRAHRAAIHSAVVQGMAAVQVDPIRNSQPLTIASDEEAQQALNQLRDLLQRPHLSWEEVVALVRPLVSSGAPPPPAPAPKASGASERHWRPGTYGADASRNRPRNPTDQGFDWGDGRYRK